ncbi:MAG: hypothetical protein ACR2J5_09405 [Geodermatophilaceae bacterium]
MVEQQMALLRSTRGAHAHAQLIGGEVSLLDADDHAAALQVMERFGRVPMSFTHGDFDYDYLERIVLDAQRRPRLAKISFAAHFDITMRGRRCVPRPLTERTSIRPATISARCSTVCDLSTAWPRSSRTT